MQIFGTAAGAAEKLNRAIGRKSEIDGTDLASGHHLDTIDGDVKLENITFAYPSRPDTNVLNDLSITIPAYKHTAIVGKSGSGKSTVAALLARLYDPHQGTVRLDGHDLRELNVAQVRGCIGAVQQDPCLLDRSILENIAHGLLNSHSSTPEELDAILDGSLAAFATKVKDGSSFDATLATEGQAVKNVVERVLNAATIADAAGFIGHLEHGLATDVGSAGNQLRCVLDRPHLKSELTI